MKEALSLAIMGWNALKPDTRKAIGSFIGSIPEAIGSIIRGEEIDPDTVPRPLTEEQFRERAGLPPKS